MVSAAEVEGIFATLTGHLARAGMDVIVLEVADGLYQTETATTGAFRSVWTRTRRPFFSVNC